MILPEVIQSRMHALSVGFDWQAKASSKVVRLNVPMQEQRGINWCWAAVAVSLQNHLNTGNKTQCELAAEQINHNDHDCCAVEPISETCDLQSSLELALERVGVKVVPESRALDAVEATDLIKSNRPFALLIEFPPPFVNHFVQFDGYVEGGGVNPDCIINDPWRHEVRQPFDELRTNYAKANGVWKRTFFIG